ncbi:Cytochrome c1 heme lyase, partial [Teratosphaeriaceae sp. CCFEE 6253]
MRPEGADPADKCPVDPKTRERWLEAAKAKGPAAPAHPATPSSTQHIPPSCFSLDTSSWQTSTHSPLPSISPASQPKRPKIYRLSTDREISTIPRAIPSTPDRPLHHAEKAALPTSPTATPAAASHGIPANSEADTGHDAASGNWIYPSQEMFFAAMRRKGHDGASPDDMRTIIPIHNAVNERAWAEIKTWEQGRGSEACGGPKLVSFAGDSKALTPRARWKGWMGYQTPFDRHDWVVDRCGREVEYVIDFYSGKGNSGDRGLNFYLDVRPKLNSWEGI